jgi:general secretion pathway protein I
MKTVRGFTLLEVLIAVAVLALALTAIIKGGANYARSASDLRDKTLALWVAHDRLTQIDLQPSWPQIGDSSDDMAMGGITWTWHVHVSGTQDPTLRRLDIYVLKKGDGSGRNYAALTDFLSSAGRCGTALTC